MRLRLAIRGMLTGMWFVCLVWTPNVIFGVAFILSAAYLIHLIKNGENA